jgi:hypothetical protein
VRGVDWEQTAGGRRCRATACAVLVAGILTAPAAARGPVPTPIGAGPLFHPQPSNARVLQGRPIGSLRCGGAASRFGVHLELFARGRVVIVPSGIGVASPHVRSGAYVRPLGCTYPLRTLEPTGVIEVRRGATLRLSHLFAVWGRPLTPTRFVGFRTTRAAPVRAYVAGHRWRGRIGAIPLRRHSQIVLQLGRYIRPHRTFLFRSGL